MQLTFETAWYPSKPQQKIIQNHMRRFQSVKRITFNRLLEKNPRQAVVILIRQQSLLSNARYIRSAIAEAQTTLHAQHELVKLYCKETKWKVQRANQRLKRYQQSLNRKQHSLTKKQYQTLTNLHTCFQKAQSAQIKWETHRKYKTIPTLVFGGKQHLRKYQKGYLSKEEWVMRRDNGIYCIGEKNKKGNANLRLHYDPITDKFTFSMLLDQGQKNERLQALLYVPVKQRPLFKRLSKGQEKYTVRVLLTDDRTCCRVLVTVDQITTGIPNNNGIAGFDLNPTGLAVTLAYSDGNFRRSKWFSCPDLMYARREKRNWLIGHIVKQAFKWISSYKLNTISLEALKFINKFDTNKKFNRIKTNFVHRKIVQIIQAQAIKLNMVIKTINPAYTSILGKLKYQRCYGLNPHQAAALVIARRGLGFNEKLYAHNNGKQMVLVVPPMEGWTPKQIRRLFREIDEFTARLSNLTSKVSEGTPRLFTRRQGSGGGIVPRNHTLTPGKGASVHPGV